MKSFKDKVAAITGAGSGMGRELAIELAKRGCHVAISDVNEAGLAQTAEIVKRYPVRVTTQKLDVADRDAVYAWADKVVADHGKVNLIFNNAGVALATTLEGADYGDFEWIMGINFWGVVYGSKAFLPHLRASGEGHIVNTSSIFGLFAVPGNGCYNASKFAVRGFNECLRQELELMKAPVSLTSVHPGGIKTGIAKAARTSKSIEGVLARDIDSAKVNFDKLFITSANRAACIILKAVEGNKRRVLVGPDAKFLDIVVRLLPALYQPLITFFARQQAQRA
ncbi:SDR family NAD(P)-dependent oxidoreductase [Solimonas variicoloris]|uniref:SDR family NAD(P)-dependent oxidoreductase n=1 Tax=Solimonas variicoloris TaxID=254408 RepID=UPI00037A6EDC|nr:SDR family NAD(P)-dependent oxidoreductase [Solimonas variicoloris]